MKRRRFKHHQLVRFSGLKQYQSSLLNMKYFIFDVLSFSNKLKMLNLQTNPYDQCPSVRGRLRVQARPLLLRRVKKYMVIRSNERVYRCEDMPFGRLDCFLDPSPKVVGLKSWGVRLSFRPLGMCSMARPGPTTLVGPGRAGLWLGTVSEQFRNNGNWYCSNYKTC